jgi:hypothetical protein
MYVLKLFIMNLLQFQYIFLRSFFVLSYISCKKHTAGEDIRKHVSADEPPSCSSLLAWDRDVYIAGVLCVKCVE